MIGFNIALITGSKASNNLALKACSSGVYLVGSFLESLFQKDMSNCFFYIVRFLFI